MNLFKTFWKVINKYKGTIILYTVMLIIFGGINMTSNDTTVDFQNSKPKIKIVNQDESLLASNLVSYLERESDVSNIDDNKIDDALFYRDISYVIYIKEGFGKNVRDKKDLIDVKSVGDYNSTLAENLLKRYLKIQNIYASEFDNDDELVHMINESIDSKTEVRVKSKLNTTELTRVSRYYSFASYSIMAVIIFIICLVMSSFNCESVYKRTKISSMSLTKYNTQIFLSSITYGLIVFILYTVLAFIIFGNVMFTLRGLIYIINSFLFTIVALSFSLLISTIVKNKDAISGIVNVISLGSAFLCGAFVPTEMLPEGVLSFAHVLPAYYYINSNDLLITIENISVSTLKPVFNNFLVLTIFTIMFVILNNVIAHVKRKS